ncbi:MAG: hypothetical protein GY754_35335 [bacterium]|nr:hypothetical protein [bacterium]
MTLKENTQNRIPLRVIARYMLFQIPELTIIIIVLYILHQSLEFPAWYGYIAVSISIVKDAILFPFVWKSYDSRGNDPGEAMIGKTGITREQLSPESPRGYIHVDNVLWKAELAENHAAVEKGEPVSIAAIKGLTVTVIPKN